MIEFGEVNFLSKHLKTIGYKLVAYLRKNPKYKKYSRKGKRYQHKMKRLRREEHVIMNCYLDKNRKKTTKYVLDKMIVTKVFIILLLWY